MVHVSADDRALLHADHCDMMAAFLESDVEQLLTLSEQHAHRLNAVIATLPTDRGLLVAQDISCAQ